MASAAGHRTCSFAIAARTAVLGCCQASLSCPWAAMAGCSTEAIKSAIARQAVIVRAGFEGSS